MNINDGICLKHGFSWTGACSSDGVRYDRWRKDNTVILANKSSNHPDNTYNVYVNDARINKYEFHNVDRALLFVSCHLNKLDNRINIC